MKNVNSELWSENHPTLFVLYFFTLCKTFQTMVHMMTFIFTYLDYLWEDLLLTKTRFFK